MVVCKNCGCVQVPATPTDLDRLARDLEYDGDYAAGMLRLRSTETDAQPAFWMCAECLTKPTW